MYFLLFFCFLVVNDGLTGVLAAYLSRTVRYPRSHTDAPFLHLPPTARACRPH